MASLVVGSFSFDMTNWDLSDLAGGTVTSSGASEIDVTGAGGRLVYTITGSGFTTFDTNGFPTDGTVTGFTEAVTGRTPIVVKTISISASDFMGFVNGNNADGLEAVIFSGNDSLSGRAGNDTLLGFDGNDTFNLTKGGNDTVQGDDGNDTFIFGAAFTTSDSIDGGTGTDKVTLNGDYSAGVTFGAATMVNVEDMTLTGAHTYNLTFNAASDITGQSLDVTASAVSGASNHVALDGSALAGTLRLVGTAGDDTLKGGAGSNTLNGGDGNDTIFAGLGDNHVNGGHGANTFIFRNWTAGDYAAGGTLNLSGDSSSGSTTTAAFAAGQISNVPLLNLDPSHGYNLTFGAGSIVAGQKFEIDGQGDTHAITIDASAAAGRFQIFGGSGPDHLIGGSGDDFITGGSGGDIYDISAGGNDNVSGGSGNDTILAGAAFDDNDKIDGGGGSDTLVIDGNDDSLSFFGHFVKNIGTLQFGAGHSYEVDTDDEFVVKLVDASRLGASDSLTYNAETSGTSFIGGAGNDVLTGYDRQGGSNTFDLSEGGEDTASGPGTFNMGAALDAGDRLDADFTGTLNVDGDYSTPVVFDDATFQHFQTFQAANGASNSDTYDFVTADGNVTAGHILMVVAAGASFIWDGSAETDGAFQFTSVGTAATHLAITGGAGNDTLSLRVTQFNSSDTFDGGGGATNVFSLTGINAPTAVVFGDDTIQNVSQLFLSSGINLQTADGNVAAGATLNVQLSSGTVARAKFDGSAETDGHFNITALNTVTVLGGQMSDTITLSSGSMQGNGGADHLIDAGGGGSGVHTTFDYGPASDSTGAGYDTVDNFNVSRDFFSLVGGQTISAVDAQVTAGALSTASFDTDLAAAVGASQLGADHAVVFTPNSGTLSGTHFLVVDLNGVAGYQAGQDLVIDLHAATSLALTTANFI
jgi:Ca2+-binding RTX toxin-like protein